MNVLAQKVKNTALFTPDEKVEILAAIDTFSDSDKAQLTDIVEEYDRKFDNITATFKQNMINHLDDMEKKMPQGNMEKFREAIKKIKSGLDMAMPNPAS